MEVYGKVPGQPEVATYGFDGEKDEEHIITQDMITEYDWGFDFVYGFVVNTSPAVINDTTYDSVGLYLKSVYYHLSDRFVELYHTYGMEIYHKIDSKYIPTNIISTTTYTDGNEVEY